MSTEFSFGQEHCLKSVRIWSYSCPHFSAFGLNTRENADQNNSHCVKSVQIRSYFWKIPTRNNSVFGHFSRSVRIRTLFTHWKPVTSYIRTWNVPFKKLINLFYEMMVSNRIKWASWSFFKKVLYFPPYFLPLCFPKYSSNKLEFHNKSQN